MTDKYKNGVIKCPKCGFNNPEGSKFCNQCGSPLLPQSRKDGHLSLVREHIPEELKKKISSVKLSGERKNVTVLFADITGFTRLSEKLDPEEVTELINKCFESMIDVIYKFEGNIDKFIGDCIMALFGAPITHEDDPERAVYAALNIMNALDRFNEGQGTKLSIHIGINSGVVVAGGVGSDLRMDYTVMGDTVNVAERLMEKAKDEILISESVFKKTLHLFETSELSPVELKGKSKKVKSFRVIGIKETPSRKRGIPELHSDIVGRSDEIQRLLSTLVEVKRTEGSVALIVGEAGVGKSRLIEEFRKKIEKDVTWLCGKCYTYGEITPFQGFRTQLFSYFQINEFDTKSKITKQLNDKIKILFRNKYGEYLPYLYLFLSIEVPKSLQEKIKYLDPKHLLLQEFVSVKTLFKEISRVKPLVLSFEDTHWMDPESLELLNFLIGGLKNSAILFLFEARPEKATEFFKIKDIIQKIYKKRFNEIRLKPLSQTDAYLLIHNLLETPGFPENAKTLILEKSEGNPFYIEEIIHSFIDAGILIKKEKIWYFEDDITSFEVPDSIDALVRSRIDGLAENIKDTLSKASVIGKIFPYRILSFLCRKNKLDFELHYLEEHEFIELKDYSDYSSMSLIPKSQSPFGVEFQFKHTLIRDIACKGLLKKQRKGIHKKTAEFMEKILGKRLKDHYEILAYHYYNAESFDKSYEYYNKAGDLAKQFYRNDSAIICFTKSIEIHKKLFQGDRGESLAELYDKRGDVEEIKAEYENAIKDYQFALKNYRDVEKKAKVKSKIGRILRQKGKIDEAIAAYKEAMEMLKGKTYSVVLSETLINYGFVLADGKNDFKKAQEAIEEALKKLNRKTEKKTYARGLTTLGNVFSLKTDFEKALKNHLKALAIYDKLNDKKGIVVTSNNIGNLYHDNGELDTALKFYKVGLQTCKEIGYKSGFGVLSGNIGVLYWKKGKFDIALDYCKTYLSISEEIGDRVGIGRASSKIGNIYFSKGELDKALSYYKRYLEISEETGDKLGVDIASDSIGSVFQNKGKLNTALEYFKKGYKIAEEIGYKDGVGVSSCNIGTVYLSKGLISTAKKYLELSERLFLEIGDKINLSLVYSALSSLYTNKVDLDSAFMYSKKALALVKETGAKQIEVVALRSLGKALAELSEEQAKTPKNRREKLSSRTLNKAVINLRKAISIARAEKMDIDLAVSLNEIGKILNRAGKRKEALKYVKEAKTIFAKIGIVPPP